MSQERIQELSKKIKAARQTYYNLSPEISDQEYDAIVDELRQLQPEHEQIQAVGAPVPNISVWEKVKHEIPMGSLDKVNSAKEFDEWAVGTSSDIFHITHKIDGSSMELVYQAGKLVRCASRGDGVIGEDVTTNIVQIPSIPKQLPVPKTVTVRGEVVMLKKVFEEKYSEKYANPRNTAAGKVRDKKGGGADCANLSFLAYRLHGETDCKTMFYMFKELESLGFQTPVCMAGNIDGIKIDFEQAVKIRDAVPYEIDGMVISVNDLKAQEELGELNMRPRGQIAWKFDPAMGITTMLDIKWQVGNSGRCTPVGVLAPVNVGGVTITSVSLHNMAMFNDLKLFQGCRVLISRRGDVIPFIEKNLDADT
jgi:DNA ligase (NAD+)